MTYAEARTATVSKHEAIAEIKAHCLDPEEFFQEVGKRAIYKASTVLGWIGY